MQPEVQGRKMRDADSDKSYATFLVAKDTVLDTSELEAEKKHLLEELNIVSAMIQKSIEKNSRIAQNQEEYRKHFDELNSRYDRTRERYNEVSEQIT